MKVFLSSVRRGLEEERDALPGLILAIGHTPVRFEDFGAQPTPSRETCLAGVAAADVYLLVLGPRYGEPLPDTGQSPTHDEWVAAHASGIPRLVYRKEGVTFDEEQEAFVQSISDYASGVFYDRFSTTAELLTKVAGRIRELERSATSLTFSPLSGPVAVTWRSAFHEQIQHADLSSPVLEIHIVPVGVPARPTRVMRDLAQVVPVRLRESGLVDTSAPLSTSRPAEAVMVTTLPPTRTTALNTVQEPQLLGIRLGTDGQASAWAALPRDGMGAILDETELPGQIAGLLRLIGQLRVVGSSNVAIACGVTPTMLLSVGRVALLPRHSATMLSMSDRPIRVEPDELVSSAALDTGAPEVGRTLAGALMEAADVRS